VVEKGRGGAEKRKKLHVAVWNAKQENVGGARACIPSGKIKSFLSSFRNRAKHAECGRARSRNFCFGHVLVAVRQGQRLGDATAGKEQFV
jgi:hypothetical protein